MKTREDKFFEIACAVVNGDHEKYPMIIEEGKKSSVRILGVAEYDLHLSDEECAFILQVVNEAKARLELQANGVWEWFETTIRSK